MRKCASWAREALDPSYNPMIDDDPITAGTGLALTEAAPESCQRSCKGVSSALPVVQAAPASELRSVETARAPAGPDENVQVASVAHGITPDQGTNENDRGIVNGNQSNHASSSLRRSPLKSPDAVCSGDLSNSAGTAAGTGCGHHIAPQLF
jgi:hypothetical protein